MNQATTTSDAQQLTQALALAQKCMAQSQPCQATFSIKNPATGDEITTLPDMDGSQTKAAVMQLNAAFPAWQALNKYERIQPLVKWANAVRQHCEELAVLLTSEQGKPLEQARSEILWSACLIETHAEHSKHIHGYTHPCASEGQETMILKQAIGVVAIITPWNFPAGLSVSSISAALACGNTVICKTAEDTPLTVAALIALAYEAGIPPSVCQYISSNQPASVGNVLCDMPQVRMLSFTGSSKTGELLYQQSAKTLKKILLELGGNSPFIVFEDANIQQAAKQAAALKFKNCGQICVNANRFLIQDSIYDTFVQHLLEETQKIKVGNGLDATTTMGPLINQQAVDKISSLVTTAVDQGALLLCGGTLLQTELTILCANHFNQCY